MRLKQVCPSDMYIVAFVFMLQKVAGKVLKKRFFGEKNRCYVAGLQSALTFEVLASKPYLAICSFIVHTWQHKLKVKACCFYIILKWKCNFIENP